MRVLGEKMMVREWNVGKYGYYKGYSFGIDKSLDEALVMDS